MYLTHSIPHSSHCYMYSVHCTAHCLNHPDLLDTFSVSIGEIWFIYGQMSNGVTTVRIHTIQWTLYTIQCTAYYAHCTLYTAYFTLYSAIKQTCKKWRLAQMPYAEVFRMCRNLTTKTQQNKLDLFYFRIFIKILGIFKFFDILQWQFLKKRDAFISAQNSSLWKLFYSAEVVKK